MSPLGALASELRELAAAANSTVTADLVARARRVMLDVQEKYPEDVKGIWQSWSDDLQPGLKDMKAYKEHFKALEQRVRQHEKAVQAK